MPFERSQLMPSARSASGRSWNPTGSATRNGLGGVKAGESWSAIAKDYGVVWQTVATTVAEIRPDLTDQERANALRRTRSLSSRHGTAWVERYMAGESAKQIADSAGISHKTDNRPENLELRQGKHGAGVAYRCLDCGSHNVESAGLDPSRTS
jgi:hypothetical protein